MPTSATTKLSKFNSRKIKLQHKLIAPHMRKRPHMFHNTFCRHFAKLTFLVSLCCSNLTALASVVGKVLSTFRPKAELWRKARVLSSTRIPSSSFPRLTRSFSLLVGSFDSFEVHCRHQNCYYEVCRGKIFLLDFPVKDLY